MAKIAKETYRDLLTQTSEQVEAEQLDIRVEQADNNFQQGLLSIKGKLLTQESVVKCKEMDLKKAELEIKNAKRSSPQDLVQCLVNAYQKVEQARLNLDASKQELNELGGLYQFLQDTRKELFPQ